MIERFLPGLDALLAEPLDTYLVSVAFPGGMDPQEREGRFGIFLDAELRIAGLGTCGGGTLIETLDDAGQWRPACAILDVDLIDLERGRAFCRDELVAAGYDVIVVDQTTPEQRRLGLRTVCTLVPGLLPIDFGWNRQRALEMPRLRTAFRRAGWRRDDLPEDGIRRVPHPFP